MWPKEDIPNESSILMRVFRTFITQGYVLPNAFRDQGGGMSVDWDKYATPAETRARARTPENNAVISMVVGAVRNVDGLAVEHEPVQENSSDERGNPLRPNRAHCEVFGEKTTERRVKLSRLWRWEVPLEE
jgi:hypothetical protein